MENRIWIIVSNRLPLQVLDEYTKNWTNNLNDQKIPKPKEIRLPKVVLR